MAGARTAQATSRQPAAQTAHPDLLLATALFMMCSFFLPFRVYVLHVSEVIVRSRENVPILDDRERKGKKKRQNVVV
jgi:hypothetical protein